MSDLQLALLFPYIPFLGLVIAFALAGLIMDATDGNDEDDDNGPDDGIMIPAYVPASNPA